MPVSARSDALPNEPAGYGGEGYVRSLAEWGRPSRLEGAGGWILTRAIPGSEMRDAMGPYPVLARDDWRALCEDLHVREGRLVSVTAVADPFGGHVRSDLETCFEFVRPFKDRYVTDLSKPRNERVSARQPAAGQAIRKDRGG